MDGVALASVISSGVVGLSGGAVTFWGPIATARQDRRTKKLDRRADVYLDVLRMAELESRALMAITTQWAISENYGVGRAPANVTTPDVQEQALIVSRLRAFGSTGVRDRFDEWRRSADAVDGEQEYQHSGWELNHDDPSTDKLFRELHPAEVQARAALADAIAAELDAGSR